ncbi:hypothetical protein SAMN03159338_0218 [Sphingomonas sp. NFR04]|uniref:hypothetical protein n=1 Tax=Sphingomonas sp. NFR04 TaxID=1566283 RepID=UPI0008F24FDE|nr:hypothetical protein [Sphingomonas sp. NFR04]SFK62495.1 hypothetical protein SAMN03159338_0218 [Sphingomonas sp. NFR04]
MTASKSEAFLKTVGDRTFLKLWTWANTHYKQGKEAADFVIPFGDDIVLISDKACHYNPEEHGALAWSRWLRRVKEKSLKQLGGGMRTIRERPGNVRMDPKLKEGTPWPLNADRTARIHLVGIARPALDPAIVPNDWKSFTYVGHEIDKPFTIGPIREGDHVVHLFDGPTIDLLLEYLDTAPDFIAYLKGREAVLRSTNDYAFNESDLLAAALIGWESNPKLLPLVPSLESVKPGLWNQYKNSERAAQTRELDRPSRLIDEYLNGQYEELREGRFIDSDPTIAEHEFAMRLLASEGRYPRRMIAEEIFDLLKEENQKIFWANTMPSPTTPDLRYVCMTFPPRPQDWTQEQQDDYCRDQLIQHMLVARFAFKQELILGICLGNPATDDGSVYTHAGRFPATRELVESAALLQKAGIFGNLQCINRLHFR